MTKSDNMSGAYALDALSADERATHAAALRASQEALNEATELQDTAVLLGLAVEPVTPSAELRERLFAQIAVTPQLPRLELVETTVDAAPGPAETRARLRWSRPVVAMTSLAAAVGLIVGGVAVATSSLQPEPTFQSQQLAAIDSAPDRQQLAADVAGGGTATLVWSNALATSAVTMEGVQTLPEGSVYQLWYIGAEGPRSAGIMATSPSDTSWRVLDGTMQAGDTIGVTVEPEGGSEQPTTTPVVAITAA